MQLDNADSCKVVGTPTLIVGGGKFRPVRGRNLIMVMSGWILHVDTMPKDGPVFHRQEFA